MKGLCGIAGIIGPSRERVASALARMLRCQAHRGPDDEGIELIQVGNCWVGLGQRRLSIIDLSPAGHQPMVNHDSGDVITFNGEIYNYLDLRAPYVSKGVRFRGHSDTEVLLHGAGEHGAKFFERTYGMFAVAFYDARRKGVMLTRDPMGIKPLYVAEAEGCLLFASEVRSILASGLVPARPDARAMATALAYGCVQEPLSFFEGIRAFPPGAWEWIDLDPSSGSYRRGQRGTHWAFPKVDESMNERDAVERLRETLDLSVKQHMIADVPVGVFLSSGVDSTIIANLARRHTDRLRTFTVGFSDQPDMTESRLAQETARLLGVDHTDVQVTGGEAQSWFVDWLESLDQPSADGLNTFIISKAVRRHGIVVALSGLGGDELFAGYITFEELMRVKRGHGMMGFLPSSMRRAAFLMGSMHKPASVREKIADMGATDGDLLSLYLYRRRFKSDQRLRAHGLIPEDLGLHPTYMPHEALEGAEENGADIPAAVSRLESRFYMRNMLLRDSDTNAMAHSLEIRVPFLDTRMLDFAYAVPGKVKMPTGKYGKHLLRTAFDDLLHTELKAQGKRGFVLPTKRWMAGPLRELCEEALVSAKNIGVLHPEHIDSVWQEFLADPDKQVWSSALLLVVLGQYAKSAAGFAPGSGGDEAPASLMKPKVEAVAGAGAGR
ncbi:MAG: asparagine synthase (glutamine-hydrolyzing) [Phycisphaerales bacterium]